MGNLSPEEWARIIAALAYQYDGIDDPDGEHEKNLMLIEKIRSNQTEG